MNRNQKNSTFKQSNYMSLKLLLSMFKYVAVSNKTIRVRILSIIIVVLNFSKSYCQIEKGEYSELVKKVAIKRNNILKAYSKADSLKKDSIIKETKDYLFRITSKEVFPQWYGTQWDFNGVTRTPKKGKIACGYFVTNILTDLGFNIPRIKWAQSASEVFIKKIASKGQTKRFMKRPLNEVKRYLMSLGNGIYLVGLDIHVGFIVAENNKLRFVHSSYYKPGEGVISEKLDSWNPLRDSNYRIVGKIFSDKMIENWIKGTRYD